jgi:hypothetical protein
MTPLDSLGIIDIRSQLPRKAWSIGTRRHNPNSLTVHYNGPAVPVARQRGAGLIDQLIIDAQWQMRPGGLGATDGGDGLQYAVVFAADGQIYQTRDWNAVLWHCGNADGNANSLALHFPLGGDQDATDAQWAAFSRFCDATIATWGISGRARVFGHHEWSESICPGAFLWPRLVNWRQDPMQQLGEAGNYRVKSLSWLRQGPGVHFPRAFDASTGTPFVLERDAVVAVDAVVIGAPVKGDPRWGHLADGRGFVHLSQIERV